MELTESVTEGGFTTIKESSETLDGGEAAGRNLRHHVVDRLRALHCQYPESQRDSSRLPLSSWCSTLEIKRP
jgi:hypothetical protein